MLDMAFPGGVTFWSMFSCRLVLRIMDGLFLDCTLDLFSADTYKHIHSDIHI